MQREFPARGWRHWTGRILPVLGAALLVLGPVHGKDKKKKKHAEEDAPAEMQVPTPGSPPPLVQAPGRNAPPAFGMREAPRPVQQVVSIDRVIEQVERRYKARVVRVDKKQRDDRLIYELRLMSEEKRVWTVKVDAETGKEI
jgi:uncharacterized membrane protein YkoI